MCLATPLKIEKITQRVATVIHSEQSYKVSLNLIPKAKIGDWILAHGEMGISILPEKEALEILKLIEKSKE